MRSRRRGLILLAGGVAVLASGAAALVLASIEPGAWRSARASVQGPEADARAVAFEKAFAAAIHQVRGPEPWAVAIPPADLNDWLAQRWRPWADFAGDSIPEDLRRQPLERSALAIDEDGSLLVMLSRRGRVDWCRLEVIGDPGAVGLVVAGVGSGALPLPSALASGLAGDLARLGVGLPALPLADGRTVRVLDLAFQDGTIVLQCRTDPASR